ncbi:S8 family peptidase [Photobacterium sp.]|uniref:S8 family peptidase n=1 Tax=Photobacterium sp. TaxID=660 RepID=UPI00299E24D7|nr:S8 family peptidase [Photobacterium sp.]MDX1301195.1 S8 family peptidase [Photobacterium sp.]
MKNVIIGYGETLTDTVEIKSGGGDKNHPYSEYESRKRFVQGLGQTLSQLDSKPEIECANGEIVVKFIQHPAYLAKTYYPKRLFQKYGMNDLGSKPVMVKPEKWATKKHPVQAVSSCIYVSGTKAEYHKLMSDVKSGNIDGTTLNSIRTFESILSVERKEKIKAITQESSTLRLEVVIHASEHDKSVIDDFKKYLHYLDGNLEEARVKVVGGLTFVPVNLPKGHEEKLADFSHLRALRSVPKLRFNKPDVIRNVIASDIVLPMYQSLNNNFKVCIFDGGMGNAHALGPWVNEIIPEDVTSLHPSLLAHGSEVCSTYLFGPYINEKLSSPYTNVDIVRVLSPDDDDPDLFDVLTRIENVLKQKKYKYINLSLGPRMSVEDDDVHVWTSVLDQYLQDGNCLATVAIGNDGDLPGELSRIQPPSDMVNSLSVGACDSTDDTWKRSSYSCIGPGRSPGVVKPDGVAFGGSNENPFMVYSPLTHQIIGTMGTSYSAPSVLRVAAGIDAITDFDLTATTIKALMVHKTDKQENDIKEVGWGRFPLNPEEVVECLEDEATIIFQGTLNSSQHVRIPVPLPKNIDCTWVHLNATFCINTLTDPEHPLHYTRSGLEITFRANKEKYPTEGNHPKPSSFFSCGELYSNEHELRDDAHKWETCLSRNKRFKRTTLNEPIFDVKYRAREQGASATEQLPPIQYSLVLTIRSQGDSSIYNSILQQNQTLQPIRISNQIRL